MIDETDGTLIIRLDGDWSMNGVADKHSALLKCFDQLSDSGASGEKQKCPSDAIPELDLAGVTDFDACGCQLLTQFIRTLEQNGIGARLTGMPDALRARIHFLGFDRELNLSH